MQIQEGNETYGPISAPFESNMLTDGDTLSYELFWDFGLKFVVPGPYGHMVLDHMVLDH